MAFVGGLLEVVPTTTTVKFSFNDNLTMKYLGAKIPDELDEKILATGRPKSDVVREALAAYFSIESAPTNKEDLIALIDERIKLNAGKTNVKLGVKSTLNTDKIGVKSELNKGKISVKPALNTDKIDTEHKLNERKTIVKPQLNDSKTDVKPILEAIKSYHDRGKEPLVSEVAEATGMETRPMGVLLKKHGIEAKSTRRDGLAGRYFVFDLKDRIEELLGYSPYP